MMMFMAFMVGGHFAFFSVEALSVAYLVADKYGVELTALT